MRQLYDRVANHPHIAGRSLGVRQFMKFSVVGGVNTVVDFGVYLILTRLLDVPYVLAGALSFTVASTNSYIWNRRWTFRDRETQVVTQYVKFFVVSAVGLGLNAGILFFLVHTWGVHDIIAKAVAIGVVVAWNFSVNKLWIFRPVTRPA